MDENINGDLLTRELFESIDDEPARAVMPPRDVVAFNEMRSCADLFRMYEKGVLQIKPDFQRGVVWKAREMSLFVDSLIKQLPIPSLCFSLDSQSGKRMVIDGLQRIWTIITFLSHEKKDWRISKIDGVDPRIAGKLVSEISKEHPDLYQILEDATLPINVIRCNYSHENHMEYLFQIFSRLNSGGRRLLYQEIRNCVYQGPYNSFLREYVHSPAWLRLVDQSPEDVDRYRFGNEERVLRFMAFYEDWESYNSCLVQYLNVYMSRNRMMADGDIATWRTLLDRTLAVLQRISGKKDTRKNWNVIECVMVGIAKNIESVEHVEDSELLERYNLLLTEDAFGDRMKEGVMHGPKVRNRMRLAIEKFRC